MTPGRWDDLFLLLKRMDADIEDLYASRGVEGMRSRFVRPLIRLAHVGPLSITELARSLGGTHSAISQTVNAMKRAGFVSTSPGSDGRTQVVALTPTAQAVVPLLESEWIATEAVVAELDDDFGGAVTELSRRLGRALAERSMAQRLRDKLDA